VPSKNSSHDLNLWTPPAITWGVYAYAYFPWLVFAPTLVALSSLGAWALNGLVLFAVTMVIALISQKNAMQRVAQRLLLGCLNTVAALTGLCLALNGSLPDTLVLVAAKDTNWREAAGLLFSAPLWSGAIGLSWLAQAWVLLKSSRVPRLRPETIMYKSAPIWILALAVPVGVPITQKTYPSAAYAIASKYYLFELEAQVIDKSQVPEVTAISPVTNEVMVFVIGESSSARYWQIAGYPEATSPRMVARQANGELLSFPRHVSVAQLTSIAVPNMLTPSGTLVRYHDKGQTSSIVSLMEKGGRRTAWISAQTPQPGSAEANDVYFESDFKSYLKHDLYDEELVPRVGAWLTKYSSVPGFVVMHTLGSHLPFEYRYPPEYARWHVPPAQYPKNQTVSNYQNSILYTDFVLDKLMKRLSQEDRPVVLVYASDHGESLMHGKSRSEVPPGDETLHVPFLVWANIAWRNAHPNDWKVLTRLVRERVPTNHLNLGPTLMHLAGFTFSGASSTKDLLSPGFHPIDNTPAYALDLHTVVTLEVSEDQNRVIK
jgi:glucan phosphoethanolaminetransferase (alkaline phosphatase superfamily)